MSTSKDEFTQKMLTLCAQRKAEAQAKADAFEAMQNEQDRKTYYGYRVEKTDGRGKQRVPRAYQC
jgi:hypothetical protein